MLFSLFLKIMSQYSYFIRMSRTEPLYYSNAVAQSVEGDLLMTTEFLIELGLAVVSLSSVDTLQHLTRSIRLMISGGFNHRLSVTWLSL